MNDRQRPGGEILLLVALGILLGVGVLVWMWAGVAGALFGSGWPRQSADELAGVLGRLPDHLADPRLAWPAAARAGLPSPAGFYAALALLGALPTAAILLLYRAHNARLLSDHRDHEQRSGARWARARELRALHNPTPLRRLVRARRASDERAGGRLALGYHGRRLLRAEARHALVVFGPTQSYKSAGLAIPALLEWRGPAVASSTKTDLLAATIRRREQLGDVMVFDPFGLSPTHTSTWSPLRAARDWDGALSTAMRITAGGELDTTTVRAVPHAEWSVRLTF